VWLQNANVYFKNEFQHPTGSFKERGGRNALMQLCESGRSAAHDRMPDCAVWHSS
jgi:threonine synthase